MRNNFLTKLVMSLLATVAILCSSCAAFAAMRTVCLEFQIRDERHNCPDEDAPGVKRPCDSDGNYVNPAGMQFELWDQDDGAASNDEFIGAWKLGGTGTQCVSFEWESASYSMGEAHPDVYAKLRYAAEPVTPYAGPVVRGVTATSSAIAAVSWRGTSRVFTDCTGTCSLPNNPMRPSGSYTTDISMRFMMLDSAQRVLEMYSSVLTGGGFIDMRYPVGTQTAGQECPTASAPARDEVCMPLDGAIFADWTTHEMGHIAQQQVFQQDGLNVAYVGGGWSMDPNERETESACSQEGWASYVSGAAWWDPDNVNSAAYYGGQFLEPATLAQTVCSNNRDVPLQCAKAYWDFDDNNQETGQGAAAASPDGRDRSTADMLRTWSSFPDGTADRQSFESGDNGVNLRDYLFYVLPITPFNQITLLDHNCLQAQELN